MGRGGYIVPPSSGLVPPVPPSQRCGLCQNFKQTTLTTRLYKVRTNLYPHLRNRSDAPDRPDRRLRPCGDPGVTDRQTDIQTQATECVTCLETDRTGVIYI